MENTTKIVLCSLDGLGGLPGPGHLALFGYDPQRYPVGRGVVEALGIDFELRLPRLGSARDEASRD